MFDTKSLTGKLFTSWLILLVVISIIVMTFIPRDSEFGINALRTVLITGMALGVFVFFNWAVPSMVFCPYWSDKEAKASTLFQES